MEKTIICLAKKLAESEAENEELRMKLKNLEHSLLVADERYDEINIEFQRISREHDECQDQIANLEKVIAEREESHLNLLQKVVELEKAAEAKPKKCGNTKPRTQAQLEVLKRGREKAAAKRAAAKRANGITPERPTAEELLQITEGADF